MYKNHTQKIYIEGHIKHQGINTQIKNLMIHKLLTAFVTITNVVIQIRVSQNGGGRNQL